MSDREIRDKVEARLLQLTEYPPCEDDWGDYYERVLVRYARWNEKSKSNIIRREQ